ncbi:MAG: hypothetical protein MRQ07_01640 [Candidatus Midichloria sp.]|nr:hypothetical protein [Candidatus Midichloria sp.]
MTQSVLNLTSLNGKDGFAIDGIYQGDQAGISVASAGDINGDGKDNIISVLLVILIRWKFRFSSR